MKNKVNPTFSGSHFLKESFKNFLKSQKFLYERLRYNKPSAALTNRQAWKDIHQSYEISEANKGHHNHDEETKQKYYGLLMGLSFFYDCEGQSILDVGGGPDSMLLRSKNFSKARIVDPGDYPSSVINTYKEKNIEYVQELAEDYTSNEQFDEVWIYNVLQHTVNTKQIIENSIRSANKRIRFLDWGYTKPFRGHPQTITTRYLIDNFKKEGWEWKSLNEKYLNDSEFQLTGWLIWGVFEKKEL
jgi:ubiquinone/menaquinone biosynthesis C-methylase UbiE